MHLSKFYSVFFALVLAFLTPLMVFAWMNGNYAVLDAEIAEKMSTAAVDAAAAARITGNYAFNSEAKRTESLNAFYGSLSSSFGTLNDTIGSTRVSAYVPCVVLADNDGAYACYGKEYLFWNSSRDAYHVTPVTTYTTDYRVSGIGDYAVSFRMDGTASIRKDGTVIMEGDYDTLLNAADADAIHALPFLNERMEYAMEAESVIQNTIVRLMEKHLNSGLDGQARIRTPLNPDGVVYHVVLHNSSGKFMSPSVLTAFIGGELRFGQDKVSHCILSAASVGKKKTYFLTKDGSTILYHAATCSKLTEDDKQSVYTDAEAAKYGAIPCPDCIR